MDAETIRARRLLGTPEPFRSGALNLASGMKPELLAANAGGIPPVVAFLARAAIMWPGLLLDENIKTTAGMVVATTLDPDLVPGHRKKVPSGSHLRSGTMFVAPSASSSAPAEHDSPVADDGLIPLLRELLERVAVLFASVLEGDAFDSKRRGYLRSALSMLQMAGSKAA